MSEFEVLLISIDWESKDKVRAIVPSKKFLKASKIEENKHEYDIVLYNKEDELYFQFAVKTKHTPFLITNEGNLNQDSRFYNIQDDLWIIKGDWRTGQRGISYHYCPSVNTIGKIEIEILDNTQDIQQLITIDINSNIDDFDFTQLKNDFEGELWNLITSKKSLVKVEKINFSYGNTTIRFPENKWVIEFIKVFDRISKNPKKELSYTKELRRIEKVIPIAETYRKLSNTGTTTLLPSKAVLEDYDIFENRFVCLMLHNIHSIVSKNVKYTSLQIERLKVEIEILIQKIAVLEDPDPKVNPEKITNELQSQEGVFIEWKRQWENRKTRFVNNCNDTADSFNELVFQISGVRYFNGETTFWGNKLNGIDTGWSALEFDTTPYDLFEDGKEITVKLFAAYRKQTIRVGNNQRNKFSVWAIQKGSFQYVSSFQDKIIHRQKVNYNKLKDSNWRQFAILSLSDINKFKKERDNQIQTLSRKIERINFQIGNIYEFNEEQSKLQPVLEQSLKTTFCKKVKWKNFQVFKPSMTFIQNVSYRNALRYYKEVLQSEGIDVDVFDLYENVTSFGLREMPQVYELWCLVTQIKVLEESFHFEHEPKDLKALLNAIDPKRQTIAEHSKIDFKNNLAGRRVTLHYQKSIPENKRPDFILEITCKGHTINLVLDSKFKNYNYKKSIVYETVDMAIKYRGHKNYVFVLHPCKDGTFEGRNIRYTNHGGEKIFYGVGDEQQIKFPFHEYGYIEMKPNFTDTLKKLLAMSFEYLLEPSRTAEDKNPKPDNEMFCINCGEDKFDIQEGNYASGGKFYKYSCIAEDSNQNKTCGHEINISYCWNCKTKLFKHGSYWDYHLESTWSIFDIRCPNCGMTVADRP